MLSLQFGVSVFAAVVTVAAFMLGLAAGSALLRERAARCARPLRRLAQLEAGVALFALLLPGLVRLTTPAIDAAAAGLSGAQWRALVACAALLALSAPAAAMGAGFPLLVEGWKRRGGSVGLAYGSNTAGAAAGALLPLALLPGLGWDAALRSVALTGLAIAAGFWVLGRGDGAPAAEPVPVPPQAGPRSPLPWYGLIGAASLMLEMSWLRLFSLALLRTEYVLALILAVMLLGMGTGSLIAARAAPQRLLPWLPWCAGLGAIGTLWLLPALSAAVERARFGSLASAMISEGLLLAVITMPVTLALGAWLPALVARYHASAARLYAVNAVGGAVGALACVVLFAQAGSCATLVLAAVTMLAAGLAVAGARRAWWALPLALAAALPVLSLPQARTLLPATLGGSHDLYRYEDGIAITQVVEQADGQRVLLTDLRRRDASSEPTAVFTQQNQARLPLMLHAQARSMLFVGVGTGISLAGSLTWPGLERTAVELSPGAIEAARTYFAASNGGVLQHTQVHADDARHFLSATTRRYDLIVGDLFHPDLAGSGSLLSVEQFGRARARLADGGLFVQWLALNQFDPDTLAVVLRSFQAAFPDAQMFLDGLHLALVGPRDHWQGVPALAGPDPAGGESQDVWLGRYWGPVDAGVGPTQHEWAPVIEYRLPQLQYRAGLALADLLRGLLARRPGIDAAAARLQLAPSRQATFRRCYIGTELWARSELAGLRGDVLASDRLLGLAYEANPDDRWIEYSLSDRLLASLDAGAEHGLTREQMLQKALIINPWSVDAWRALWKLQRAAGDAAGAAASRARIVALSPLDAIAREPAR